MDLKTWKYLLDVVETLGPDSTSSDESECDNNNDKIYYSTLKTKRMLWRHRDLSNMLEIVDNQHLLDKMTHGSAGCRPVLRL